LRAFLILRLTQIASFRSKNQRVIHESKSNRKGSWKWDSGLINQVTMNSVLPHFGNLANRD